MRCEISAMLTIVHSVGCTRRLKDDRPLPCRTVGLRLAGVHSTAGGVETNLLASLARGVCNCEP